VGFEPTSAALAAAARNEFTSGGLVAREGRSPNAGINSAPRKSKIFAGKKAAKIKILTG
jgi:hypothetical protein